MKYRHSVLLAEGDFGATGTKIVDDFGVDPISRLSIIFRPVGGSNAPVAHPASAITKIELVDGSDVLHSLTGYQTQGINVLEAPKPNAQIIHQFTGGTPQTPFHIDFGRRLWDPELAFDPKKFTNPQLKVTYNEDLWDASCESYGLSVHAHLFDEKEITPTGFLMRKEIKSYVPVSQAYEYTLLPTDYTHRALFLQGFCAGGGIRAILQAVRLDENNDKRVIIDGDVDELRNYLDELWGDAVDINIVTLADTSKTFFCTAHNHVTIQGMIDQADKGVGGKDLSGGQFWSEGEAAGLGNFICRGKNPHGMMGVPFGNQQDMADWFEVSDEMKLRLRIQGGPNSSSSYTNRIICEQYRPYE